MSTDMEMDVAAGVKKAINTRPDMEMFAVSQGKMRINQLILSLSKAVAGHTIPASATHPAAVKLGELFTKLHELSEEIEPFTERQRFGNMAFRTWVDRMHLLASDFTSQLADGPELRHYLTQSFGSQPRLDFGTGHELNFLAFMGIMLLHDGTASITGTDVLYIFAAYYKLCGRVILRYNLEPAGSHGVWGLDDHFHLVYILGSAQLAYGADDGRLTPKDVLDKRISEQEAQKNLYFWAINLVQTVKRGNFFEHSPLLFDITNVVNWNKIHRGMIKMYQDEVLGKFPVVQHFWMGQTYTLDPDPNVKTTEAEPENRNSIPASLGMMPPKTSR